MRARLTGVAKSHGAQVVLENASLEVGPRARIGLVGPNGVGKSTVLRLLGGEEAPDAGVVALDPPRATVAHLRQEPERRPGETLRARLARLTGVAAAELELEAAADALARDADTTHAMSDRYDVALARFLALGGGDLDARAAATCARVGLGVDLDRVFDGLSGGEAARVSLAAVHLVQADLLLLDEPTNDLDGDGLAQLEAFVDGFPGAIVLVSHDRAFLDRTVRRIAEIDPRSHAIVEWAGGWSDYARRRDEARHAAYAHYADARERRRELTTLLSTRRTEARAQGAGLGEKSGGADRRGTNALRTKVRQAEKLLERNPLPQKPFEPWELRLELHSSRASSDAGGTTGRRRRGARSVPARPRRPRASAGRASRRDRTERRRQVDARPRAARRARALARHARDRTWRGHRRDRSGADRLRVAGAAAPRVHRPHGPRRRGRADAAGEVRARRRRTSSVPAKRSRRASAPGRTSPSSRPPA